MPGRSRRRERPPRAAGGAVHRAAHQRHPVRRRRRRRAAVRAAGDRMASAGRRAAVAGFAAGGSRHAVDGSHARAQRRRSPGAAGAAPGSDGGRDGRGPRHPRPGGGPGGGAAGPLRRAHGAAAGLEPGPPGAGTPARVAGHATAGGRLRPEPSGRRSRAPVLLQLPGEPEAAASVAAELSAAAGVPTVLALCGPRSPAFDGLLRSRDVIIVSEAADLPGGLAELAARELRRLNRHVLVESGHGGGARRLLACVGLGRARSLGARLDSAAA